MTEVPRVDGRRAGRTAPSVAPARASKAYRRGTHRVSTPEDTWRWIEPRLATFGISRMADVTRLDVLDVPVYQAVRPRSRNISVSQGKGVSAIAAKVSAAMESIELHHAECLASLPRTTASISELEGSNPIPTEALDWLTGAPVLPSRELQWLRADSLSGGADGFLPREMLELDFRVGELLPPKIFRRTSNGLASGNVRAEAQVHALSELIERHAIHLAVEDPARKGRIDPDAVGSGDAAELIARFRRAGAKLAIHDLTWELGIPVVAADLVLEDLPRRWSGSGCHPSREVALSRALTEAAQSRLTFLSGARDDLTYSQRWPAAHVVYDDFEEPVPDRVLADLPDRASTSVEVDRDLLVGVLAEAGFQSYWVDFTRDEVGIPVGRAFAPGLGEALHV